MQDEDNGHPIRAIANDLLDEVQAERNDAYNRNIDEDEYNEAQAKALEIFGEGHDPKMVARALWMAIVDRLRESRGA